MFSNEAVRTAVRMRCERTLKHCNITVLKLIAHRAYNGLTPAFPVLMCSCGSAFSFFSFSWVSYDSLFVNLTADKAIQQK